MIDGTSAVAAPLSTFAGFINPGASCPAYPVPTPRNPPKDFGPAGSNGSGPGLERSTDPRLSKSHSRKSDTLDVSGVFAVEESDSFCCFKG